MQLPSKKIILVSIITLIVVTVGVLVFTAGPDVSLDPSLDQNFPASSSDPASDQTAETDGEVIGTSVEGREIRAYKYGSGPTHLLFVGGIHGGYEWNSIILAYEMMEYFSNPANLPSGITATVIPSANPDGLQTVVGTTTAPLTMADIPTDVSTDGTGRFNASAVDLNRNFDCNWAPESSWRGQTVSAGTAAFSEPETQAIRDFVATNQPDAAIFWHSQANTVYASECNDGVLPETVDVMNTYAQAAGYNAVESFDAYPITGDVEGWLASIGIPAVTVELETRNSSELERNRAGVEALLNYYSQQ